MKNGYNNVMDIMEHFKDKKVCLKHLEEMRWENGIVCPHCKSKEKMYRLRFNFKCSSCLKQFSVTKGTIFENSNIPLQKWFVAIYLLTSHKKGISSIQ